jgi:hypothetical protein
MIDRWYRQGFALALVATMAAQSACGGSSAASTPSGSSTQATASSSSGGTNGSSASPTVASGPHQTDIGEQPPDFPSQDPNRWVNGQAFTLASAHGDVVLVESWHRL